MKLFILSTVLAVVMAGYSHNPLHHPKHFPYFYGKNQVRFNMGIDAFKTMLHGGHGGHGGHGVHHGGHGGVLYTRWGHSQCPHHTRLVYSGFAAGTKYSNGGGAETLCLHPHPTLSKIKSSVSYPSYIYGAEYEVHGWSQNNYDVPCAVCHSWHGTNSIMIPGRDICPNYFHLEYKGILMSEYYGHTYSNTQFICIDETMQVEPGSSSNQNGKLFYPVVNGCGSQNCPPYKSGQKVTCAVCSI